MREIKFRAWVSIASRMLHDVGLTGGKVKQCIVFPDYHNDLSDLVDDNLIETDENDNIYILIGSGCDLMQYTGRNDKNGTEIFEGDILQEPGETSREPVEVFYSDSLSAFLIRNKSRTWSEYMTDRPFLKTYVVIGNIYENPELVKGNHE